MTIKPEIGQLYRYKPSGNVYMVIVNANASSDAWDLVCVQRADGLPCGCRFRFGHGFYGWDHLFELVTEPILIGANP